MFFKPQSTIPRVESSEKWWGKTDDGKTVGDVIDFGMQRALRTNKDVLNLGKSLFVPGLTKVDEENIFENTFTLI